jgi:hypothetical protein
MARPATRTQHAIRLLAVIGYIGDPVGGNDPAGTAKVIRSELRLQALDFWLRNPDYLADEFVTAVEAGCLPRRYLTVAEGLLTDPEPALHHFPMPKWFFGAYEPVDDAFALLDVYGLAQIRRLGVPPKRDRSQFFLTDAGLTAAEELATDPILGWYVSQARLVGEIAGNDTGTQLKLRQYAQEEYAEAKWGTTIESIGDQVTKRLAVMRAGTGAPAGASATGLGGER